MAGLARQGSAGMRTSVNTERLTLRRASEHDLDVYCERIYGDPDVMRMLPGRTPLPLPEARGRAHANLIQHWETRGFGPWLVLLKDSQRILGHCGLRIWPESQDVEVLYALESGAWGMGYATEAARAAVRAGFEDLSLDRLIAGADGENAASIGVLKKLGMSPWEERDFHGLRLVMFTLHRAEWNA